MPGQTHQQDVESSHKLPAEDLGSVLTSEAFYLNCFKILPCSKRYAHEWTTCPFAHPGEKAKRRDPRCYNYDCEMCPAVVKGEVCELGQACPHSHHVFESWLHPQKFRTMLCKDGDSCHREVCFFAHGAEQLRVPSRDTPNMPCFAGPSRLRRSGSGPPGTSHHHQQQQLAAGLQALQLGGLSAMCSPQGSAGRGCSPLSGMPAGASWPQAQHPNRSMMQVNSGMGFISGSQAHDAAYQAAAAAAAARAAAANAAAANAVSNWPLAYTPGSDALRRTTACGSTSSSLLQMAAMLPAGGADWQGSPQQQQQQQQTLLALVGAMSGQHTGHAGTTCTEHVAGDMYSLLTKLMDEVKTSKHEAMQSKNAADVAQEQLRLLMATLSGSQGGPEPTGLTAEQAGAAGSNGMVALLNAAAHQMSTAGGNGAFPGLMLQEAGPSGFGATSMPPLAPLASGYQSAAGEMVRQGSAGSWSQLSMQSMAGAASRAASLGLPPHPQQQQLLSSGSNAVMALMSSSSCGPSASAGSSKSGSDMALNWLQLSSIEDPSGDSVVLPRASSAAAAGLAAGDCLSLTSVLQQGGVPSGMAFSGPCVLPSALGSSAQVLDMQTTSTAISMPLPVGTAWLGQSPLEATAPAVGPPGASGFNSSSCNGLPLLPSDYLLQLQMAQGRVSIESPPANLQVPATSAIACNQQQEALAAAMTAQAAGGQLLQQAPGNAGDAGGGGVGAFGGLGLPSSSMESGAAGPMPGGILHAVPEGGAAHLGWL